MQHTSRSKATITVIVVLAALTAVNLGVSATWWVRSGAVAGPATTVVTATPTPRATSTPTAAVSLPPAAGADGIPTAEAPGSTTAPATADLATTWTPPAGMPTVGRLLRIAIPATKSHFTARDALVYLPPAALTADPPHLPVAMLLSGQSAGAGPEDLQTGGHIEETMNALATVNRGLTPIVVVPDQLGPQSANPMCVDGPLGNSKTYLEQDVPDWITTHLRVQTGASAWTVGGFSQGGTCAIQLGAGDPQRFGNLIDVSGETGPTLGSAAETIAKGFSHSAAAYRAAQPAAVMAAHGPYTATNAYFAVGAEDHRYGGETPPQAARARAAGMHVVLWELPGMAHSWITARAALAAGLAWLMPRTGLSAST